MTTPTVRALWLAISALSAVIVGAAGGLLAWAGGLNPPTAILTGASTFAGAMVLALTVLRFLSDSPE